MTRRSICLLRTGFNRSAGGVETHIEAIAGALTDMEFTILSDADSKKPRMERISPNLSVIRVGIPLRYPSWYPSRAQSLSRAISYGQRVVASIVNFSKIKRFAASSGFDLLHIQGPTILHEILRFDSIIKFRVLSPMISFWDLEMPMVLTLHGLYAHIIRSYANIIPKHHPLHKYEAALIKEFLRRGIPIICVDKYICRYISNVMNESANCTYIPNSVDLTVFTPQKMPALHGELIAGYIGRPDLVRGFDLIMKLAEKPPLGIKIMCVVPDLSEALASRLSRKSNVQVMIGLSNEQIPIPLKNMHVLLNPLKIEGISRITLEAMACGRPVIMTDIGDRYPVVHGETGFLFDGTIESLLGLLSEIRSGRYDLDTMGRKSIEVVENEFSHEVIMPKLANIYERLCRNV